MIACAAPPPVVELRRDPDPEIDEALQNLRADQAFMSLR
jgi:hypothetical protein